MLLQMLNQNQNQNKYIHMFKFFFSVVVVVVVALYFTLSSYSVDMKCQFEHFLLLLAVGLFVSA